MKTPSLNRACLVITLSLFCAFPSIATIMVLDQAFMPTDHFISAGIGGGHTRAQTFTVGLAGTLTRFDAYIESSEANVPVLWDIRRTIGGAPIQSDTATLAYGSFPGPAAAHNSFAFFSIDASSFGVAVSPGDVLAIVFRTPDINVSISWLGDTTNPYARGAAYDGTPGANSTAWSSDFINYDFGFRTYVQPIPEPSSACLIVGGAGIFLGTRRRIIRLQSSSFSSSSSIPI